MTRLLRCAAAAAILLSGASGRAAPAPPPGGGTISIERPASDAEANTVSTDVADAVGAALADRGFTLLSDPGHSAYVAEPTLSRAEVGTGSARVKGDRGTITPGGVSGVGGGVTLPLSAAKTRSVPLERVRLELAIRKRGAPVILWRGVAVTVRAGGTRSGSDAVVAADLSQAMLRFYPGRPPGTVTVP